MSHGSVLVVLPTLGDRLDFLGETITSVDAQRADVDLDARRDRARRCRRGP